MTRDVPPLPWSDPYRLLYVGAIFAGCIAASAVYGVIASMTRSWPEPFTTDQETKS